MNKADIISKKFIQIVVYLFELLAVAFLITLCTHYCIESISTYMQFVERMLLSYSIYQILVVVILTNLNDIEKDSYLAYLTTLKYCLIYAKTKSEDLKDLILDRIEKQLDVSIFNLLSTRLAYEKLKVNIDQITEENIELEIIAAEHMYEMTNLNWKFSFLLRCRIFK